MERPPHSMPQHPSGASRALLALLLLTLATSSLRAADEKLTPAFNLTARLSEVYTAGVRSVCFSPDGNRLASGAEDGSVKLWDWNGPSPEQREDPLKPR